MNLHFSTFLLWLICLDSSSGWLQVISYLRVRRRTRQWLILHWQWLSDIFFFSLGQHISCIAVWKLDVKPPFKTKKPLLCYLSHFPKYGRCGKPVWPENSCGMRNSIKTVFWLLLQNNPLLQSQLYHSTKSCQTAESCQSGQPPCVNIRKHLFVLYSIKGRRLHKLEHT